MPRDCSDAGAKIALFEQVGCILNLALAPPILYKRGLIGISACAKTLQPSAWDDASDNTHRGHRHGRSPKKNIALAAWHAPLGGRIEEADLCRRQGFRRIAPPASPRFEDWHVQGPASSESQEGILTKAAEVWAGRGPRRSTSGPPRQAKAQAGSCSRRDAPPSGRRCPVPQYGHRGVTQSRSRHDRQHLPEFGQRVR